MPVNLQPTSQTSALVLPSTGTYSDVADALAYGIYSDDDNFLSGAMEQVTYVYHKLGGNVLDIEMQPDNVYNAYEEACLMDDYLVDVELVDA